VQIDWLIDWIPPIYRPLCRPTPVVDFSWRLQNVCHIRRLPIRGSKTILRRWSSKLSCSIRYLFAAAELQRRKMPWSSSGDRHIYVHPAEGRSHSTQTAIIAHTAAPVARLFRRNFANSAELDVGPFLLTQSNPIKNCWLKLIRKLGPMCHWPLIVVIRQYLKFVKHTL